MEGHAELHSLNGSRGVLGAGGGMALGSFSTPLSDVVGAEPAANREQIFGTQVPEFHQTIGNDS
jgi:hypothetical protein